MNRRSVLVAAGAAVAGGGGTLGASAFGTDSAFGTVGTAVETEDVAILDPETGARIRSPDVGGRVRQRRVNVRQAAFDLRRTDAADADRYEVSVTFVGDDGAPLSDLESAFDGGLVDLRVFAPTASGAVRFVDAVEPRESLRDRGGQPPGPGEFLDSDGVARSHVPDVGSAAADGHGAVTVEGDRTVRCGVLATVGDSTAGEYPGLRVGVAPL